MRQQEIITHKPKAKIIKANKILQAKIGIGSIDPTVISKCQKIMDDNDLEFAPMAQEYLKSLGIALDKITMEGARGKDALEALSAPVMQLKANAKMFKYDLMGNLATIMLNFLETVKNIDEDVILLVETHRNTLGALAAKQMKGDGGEFGREMEAELQKACDRYFAKRK